MIHQHLIQHLALIGVIYNYNVPAGSDKKIVTLDMFYNWFDKLF